MRHLERESPLWHLKQNVVKYVTPGDQIKARAKRIGGWQGLLSLGSDRRERHEVNGVDGVAEPTVWERKGEGSRGPRARLPTATPLDSDIMHQQSLTAFKTDNLSLGILAAELLALGSWQEVPGTHCGTQASEGNQGNQRQRRQ